MNDWPFREAENTAVLTTRHVVDDGAPILRVSHDADDGSWQFHTGVVPSTKDARILALREVVELDSSIAGLADLPLGWVAVRSDVGEPWERHEKGRAVDEAAG